MITQSWVDVRDAIKLVLENLGLPIVHPFPRVDPTHDIQRWRNLMETNSRMDAWTILRTSAPVTIHSNCGLRVLHQVTIRGVLSLSDEDASQDEFDNKIDSILVALYPHLSLSGVATLQGPAQLALEDIRIYADTIIHYAEITTQVDQTVMVTGKT